MQVLGHTAPLARVFLSNEFGARCINGHPPGQNVELAAAFGALLRRLRQARHAWTGRACLRKVLRLWGSDIVPGLCVRAMTYCVHAWARIQNCKQYHDVLHVSGCACGAVLVL